MLNLTSSEVRVVIVWSEKGESSPFPQEMALLKRIKNNSGGREMKLNKKELEVILHWADLETRGHHGTNRYLLEQEELLINKIEKYLNDLEDNTFPL
jgi:hypothetical protein